MAEGGIEQAYSYRHDPRVPAFPDDKALFIFDGICVLCSSGCVWLMRRDRKDELRFTTTQTALGKALFDHYGIDSDATYMLIDKGRNYVKSEGYLHMLDRLGGWWMALKILYLVPRQMRDFFYAVLNRYRYQWFGKTEYCELIPEDCRGKML